MKKTVLKTSFILFCFTFLSSICLAQKVQIIQLKDGSVLKGKVTRLEDGEYTIKTNNLGSVHINQEDVRSIADKAPAQQKQDLQTRGRNLHVSSDAPLSASLGNLQPQINQMQTKILSDPKLMKNINEMLADKQLMKTLSDPNLMNDLLQKNPEEIKRDPRINRLLRDPSMQSLMNQLLQDP